MGDYAIVSAGLIIGLMARWAVVLSLGQPVTRRMIFIDMLVLSMNGLLALLFGQELGLHKVRLAVEAAMLGASSTIVFAKMQGEWLKHNAGPQILFSGQNENVTVDPSPSAVEVHNVGPDSPQTPAEVTVATLKTMPGEQGDPFADLLDKLDRND